MTTAHEGVRPLSLHVWKVSSAGLHAAPDDPNDVRARRLADFLSDVLSNLDRLDRFIEQLREVRAGRAEQASVGSNYFDGTAEPDGARLYHELLDMSEDDDVDERTLGMRFTLDEMEQGLTW